MSPADHQREIDNLIRQYFPEPKPEQRNGRPPHNGKPQGLIRRSNGHAGGVLSDDAVLNLCRKADNAAKFASLFDDGDTSAHNDDDSAADAALLSILAFYTKDRNQLERLFTLSGLNRSKWTNRPDYRTRTIEFVLENSTESYQNLSSYVSSPAYPLVKTDDNNNKSEEPEVVWFSKLGEPKERKYLLEGVCAKGYPLVAFGAGGVAKSLAMLLAGIAIAGDREQWLGIKVLDHGHVLYLDFELDVDEQHRRVRDLCAGIGVDVPARLAYLSGVGLSTEAAFSAALKFCEEHEAKAVVVDSMGLAMQGDMEQAKEVLSFHSRYVNPLRRTGATPLLVDHEGKRQAGEKHKDKSPFGSAFKAWAARSVLQFELDEYDKENSALDIRVRQTKTNFGPRLDPFGVRFTFEHNKITTEQVELEDRDLVEEESVPGRERIIGVLRSAPATRKEIKDATGLSDGGIRNLLSDLQKDEIVGEEGYQGRSKVYRLLLLSPENTKGNGSDDNNGGTHTLDCECIDCVSPAPGSVRGWEGHL